MLDIVGKRFWFFLISGAVILIGIISLATFGLKYGIEFSSGSLLTVSFEQRVDQGDLKEEIRAGRTLGAAVETGFSRAWPAIRDSNVTTFIVCLILYWVGATVIAGASVKGFALTLFIGVAVSMFSAIVVTRTLLRLFVGTRLAQRTSLFNVYTGRK